MKHDENPYHTPDNEIDLQPLIEQIKTEITEHAEAEEKRLFQKYAWCSYHDPDSKAIITAHTEKEIERIKEVFETKTMDPNDFEILGRYEDDKLIYKTVRRGNLIISYSLKKEDS